MDNGSSIRVLVVDDEPRALQLAARALESGQVTCATAGSAREAMSLSAGDELLVLCKQDRVVLMAKPASFRAKTAGLHGELWRGAAAYLKDERDDW